MPDGHHISCPNGGKKYGKETPFVGGLTYASLRIDSVNKSHFAYGSCSLDGSPRSPLTIPESDPVEIPFRTVGNYPENDIAFFEIATISIVKRKEVSGKIHSLLRNRSPPKRFKSGGVCGKGAPPSPTGEAFKNFDIFLIGAIDYV